MTVPLTLLPGGGELQVAPGISILKAAQAAGIDITATCGGRGRCTSCRVKFVSGTIPPPTIMDELQLGDALIREGYRLSCQCRVTEPITVQVAPPLDERTFQILGAARPPGAPTPMAIDAGIRKQVASVSLPKEEHHQTSDLEGLLKAVGRTTDDVAPELLKNLPAALRAQQGEVTVTRSEERRVGKECR